jgi:glycosyltransferase involved in cell wall biosynthesis
LLVPDEGITAVPGMIRQAVRVIREQGVDVLLVTVPGFSPWLAGVVASMQTGVPLVVDYRDLWHGDVLRKWIGPMRTRMELAVERWCLRRSAAVVTVSEGKTRYIRELDGAGSSKTLATIYNGFDPEDIEGISPDRPHADAHRCLLLYTGRLYRDRRIDPLVSAIGRLVQAGSVQRDEIRLRTLGLIDGDQQARIDRLVADFGLQAVVETRGYVTRSAALAQQLGADAVVLVVDPGETSDGVLPGKITEYIGLGKFVLALCPPGEARNILERYGHAASADALDQDSLDKAVLGLIDRWRTDPALLRERRINAILPTRRDNAAALAGILDTVLEGANSKCSGSIANLAVPAV